VLLQDLDGARELPQQDVLCLDAVALAETAVPQLDGHPLGRAVMGRQDRLEDLCPEGVGAAGLVVGLFR
jgi:hypothetical protein